MHGYGSLLQSPTSVASAKPFQGVILAHRHVPRARSSDCRPVALCGGPHLRLNAARVIIVQPGCLARRSCCCRRRAPATRVLLGVRAGHHAATVRAPPGRLRHSASRPACVTHLLMMTTRRVPRIYPCSGTAAEDCHLGPCAPGLPLDSTMRSIAHDSAESNVLHDVLRFWHP